MTPEEASAEIIKTLVAQARMAAGDFQIDGAVVTIPAAFNQMQCEATMRSAAAAGLNKVALLQEPIAAAMASISHSKNKNGQFLVYDLGGGTFDAAIVQTVSSSATVIAHAGINMLGGRDFDRAILNSVVRPWLLENFDLSDDFQKDVAYQRLIRVAQYRAELSKIALSTQTRDRIFADESQIGARDRDGKEIYLDVEISRDELDSFVVEEIDRSINLCRKLILDSGYRNEDIDRVVLIGGPSRMPIVRERIGSQLGTLFTFVRKGTLLPKSGAERFRASRDFRSGDGGCLEFEVYQQAEDISDPSLNLPVGAFRLFSNNLEKGDVIRKGDPVVVHWSIDENGLLDSNLEFTEISQTYNTGKMYVSAEGDRIRSDR